jgi:DNA sulfur modification protein DndB
LACHDLLRQHPNGWSSRLQVLKDIDWSRSNPIWEGRAMIGGQMSKARQNVRLMANLLKKIMGLSLTLDETRLEENFQNGKAKANRV